MFSAYAYSHGLGVRFVSYKRMFWGHTLEKRVIVMLAWAQCFVCSGVPHVLSIRKLAWAQCSVCFMKAYILGSRA